MTDREKAIVMAYTDVCMLQGEKLSFFYDYVEEIMGSRMDTLQMAMLAKEIKRKAEPDFIKLCEGATDKNVGGKWINVRDALPGLREKVLFAPKCNEGAIYIGELNAVGEHGTAYFAVMRGKYKTCYSASHWMPLPEPPKEAEDANE